MHSRGTIASVPQSEEMVLDSVGDYSVKLLSDQLQRGLFIQFSNVI